MRERRAGGRSGNRGIWASRSVPVLVFALLLVVSMGCAEAALDVSARLAWGGLQVENAVMPIRVECANTGEAWSGEIVLRPVAARLGEQGDRPFWAEGGITIRRAVELPPGSRKAYVFCPVWSRETRGYEVELCREGGGPVDARAGVGLGTVLRGSAESVGVYLRGDGTSPEGRRGIAWLDLAGRTEVAPVAMRWAAAAREEWPADLLELDPVRLVLVDPLLVQTEAPELVGVLRQWVRGGGTLALLPLTEGTGTVARVWRDWLGAVNPGWGAGARAEGLGEVRWVPRDLLAAEVGEAQAAALARAWLRVVPAAATTVRGPLGFAAVGELVNTALLRVGDFTPLLWLVVGYGVIIVGPQLWLLRRWRRREWIVWTMPVLAVAGSVGVYLASAWTSRVGARRALVGMRCFAPDSADTEAGGPLRTWHRVGGPGSYRVRQASDVVTWWAPWTLPLGRGDLVEFRVREVGMELTGRLRSGQVAEWGQARAFVAAQPQPVVRLSIEGTAPSGEVQGRLRLLEGAPAAGWGLSWLTYAGHAAVISPDRWAEARQPGGISVLLADRTAAFLGGNRMLSPRTELDEMSYAYLQVEEDEWFCQRADPARAYLVVLVTGLDALFRWPGEEWDGTEPAWRSVSGMIVLDLGRPALAGVSADCLGWFVQVWADTGGNRGNRFFPGPPGEHWDSWLGEWYEVFMYGSRTPGYYYQRRARSGPADSSAASEDASVEWPAGDEVGHWRAGVVSWPGGVLYAELFPIGGAGGMDGARAMDWPEEWSSMGVVADLHNWEDGSWLRVMPGRILLDPIEAFLEPVKGSLLLRLQSDRPVMLDMDRLCLSADVTAKDSWRDGD